MSIFIDCDHSKDLLTSDIKKSLGLDLDKYRYQTNKKEQKFYLEIKNKISQIMNDFVGIIRKEEELNKALEQIQKLEESSKKLNIFYSIQLKNIITVCLLITKSAMYREESRGTHISEKFPQESNDWQSHIVWQKDSPAPVLEIIN